ncbi:MAG: hypothetical protein ABWZ40_09615 [Caulobacterales bacterium]
MRSILLGIAAATTLAACSTPTRYEPMTKKTGSGYSETRIEDNRFRITFRGGQGESAARVKDLALLRAADLATTNGYDWFEVVNRFGEENDSSGPRVGVGGGGGNFGGSTAVGVGLGTSFNLSGPVRTETIEVLMGKGDRPDRPNVYTAAGIKQSISAPAAKAKS